jgi:hypothetical protein
MLRAKFVYDVRHVARLLHANVARTCRARSAQQGMLLSYTSVGFTLVKYPSFGEGPLDLTWSKFGPSGENSCN